MAIENREAVSRLYKYFSEATDNQGVAKTVGIEVETSFLKADKTPIDIEQSQRMFKYLVKKYGFMIASEKSSLITEVKDWRGNRILYELGRQNIEVATVPGSICGVVHSTLEILEKLYDAGVKAEAFPLFEPILKNKENLLVIPDERDAIWLELDGREALELLSRISAVQFTISVPSAEHGVFLIRKLLDQRERFLEDYPQDEIWRKYIRMSKAGYLDERYGGPGNLYNLRDYCGALVRHDVVLGPKLVPHIEVEDLNVPLFLRSVWWYFRLKKYGKTICIEVRPIARREDSKIESQLEMVLDILFSL